MSLVRPVQDRHPLPDGLLDEVLDRVMDCLSDGPVLIQCEMGRSRSAGVAYALLRALYGQSHDEAYARVHTQTVFQAGKNQLSFDWPHPKLLASAAAWVDQRDQLRG